MTKVTIKTGALLNAFSALQTIANEKLPVKGSYAVSRLLVKLQAEHKVAEEHRIALVKELGTPDEQGNFMIEPGTAAFDEFQAKFGELQDTDLELDVPLIKIEQLGDAKIAPAVFAVLEAFVAEDAA